MSSPIRNETDERLLATPTMYAPPWAREQAREEAVEAAEKALTASEEFRDSLPPAPLLEEPEKRKRWREREPKPVEGDLANVKLRERNTLDPVAVAPPPLKERGSGAGVIAARVAGAVGFAAVAAFVLVGTVPLKSAVKAESESALPTIWSRVTGGAKPQPYSLASAAQEETAAPLAERFAAAETVAPAPTPIAPRVVQTVPVQQPAPVQQAAPVQMAAVQPAAQPVPRVQSEPAPPAAPRTISTDELVILFKRSEELVRQGDIAAARLLLTRAAEAGDARAALTLGATYDAEMLRQIGVRGIAGEPAQARAWYTKAAELGSGEAARRLEQLAQTSR
jgi:hypothetical protein